MNDSECKLRLFGILVCNRLSTGEGRLASTDFLHPHSESIRRRESAFSRVGEALKPEVAVAVTLRDLVFIKYGLVTRNEKGL